MKRGHVQFILAILVFGVTLGSIKADSDEAPSAVTVSAAVPTNDSVVSTTVPTNNATIPTPVTTVLTTEKPVSKTTSATTSTPVTAAPTTEKPVSKTTHATTTPVTTTPTTEKPVPTATKATLETPVPTVPTTVKPSPSITNPTTVSATVPETSAPTVSTTVSATSAPTVSTTVQATSAPTVSTTVSATSAPTVSTTVPATSATTVSTTVPTTNATIVSTTVPATNATIVSTTVSATNATIVSTPSSATNATSATASSAVTTPSTVSTTSKNSSSSQAPSQPTTALPDSYKKYDYILNNDNTNVPCVFAKMNIVMKLKYQMKDSKWRDVTLTVPRKAALEGNCNEKLINAALVWGELTAKTLDNDENKKSKVILSLVNKDDKFSVDSIALDLYMNERNFPNTDETRFISTTNTSLGLFTASSKNGVYRCSGEVEVPVGKNAALTVSDVSLIAFNTDKNIDSKSEQNCVAEASTNVGAIVGGVIGGLALVGIISFVIWRRRKNDLNRSEMP